MMAEADDSKSNSDRLKTRCTSDTSSISRTLKTMMKWEQRAAQAILTHSVCSGRLSVKGSLLAESQLCSGTGGSIFSLGAR
mmetsp:Transcript_32994/g.46046  ORF Transcript_32994/g.46046 Transcript_32994/m.46046 type:complete len:81 (+) Transcript_32994:290-532(+)